MNRNKNILVAVFIALFAFLLLYSTTSDIGITCDEAWINDSAAHSFAQWMSMTAKDIIRGDFTTFRSKESIEKYFGGHFHYHPPFGRMMHALSLIFFGNIAGEIKALRISPEIMFSIICALVFLITLRFTDYISAFTASLGLLFMPRMFGHGHIFALDIPVTFMWTLTVFFFLKCDEKPIYKYLFALSLGLSFCTKAQSALIPVAIFLWLILFPDKKKFSILTFGTMGAIAVFYFTNPWLWVDFTSHFTEFISGMSTHTEDFVVRTYYLGKKFNSNALPWHYPFLLSFFTIPAPYILLIVISVTAIAINLFNRLKEVFAKSVNISNEKYAIFILINALIPLIVVSSGIAPSYDGERLFLPAFPFLAILSGFGFMKIKMLCFRGKSAAGAYILSSLLILSSAISLYGIHPYELSYFNIYAGGLKGAKKIGMETTYWGDAFNKNTLGFINNNLRSKKIAGRALFNTILFDYYYDYGILSNDVIYDEDDYDYIIINHREGLLGEEEEFYTEQMIPVFSNNHNGVPLLSIYKSLDKSTENDFILFGKQKDIWKNTVISFNPFAEKEKTGNNIFPLIASIGDFSQATFNSIIRTTEKGAYRLYIFSRGNFTLSVDGRIISKSLSKKKKYIKTTVVLGKGYHIAEGMYESNESQKPFFAVIAKKVQNEQ